MFDVLSFFLIILSHTGFSDNNPTQHCLKYPAVLTIGEMRNKNGEYNIFRFSFAFPLTLPRSLLFDFINRIARISFDFLIKILLVLVSY